MVDTIQRRLSFIAILLLVLTIAGCQTGDPVQKELASIELECADLCKAMKTPPFKGEYYTFDHVQDLQVFQRAIRKAVKLKADLDYGVMFRMHLSFKDGTRKTMVLNVADKDGLTALLVDTADRIFYEIPKAQTTELRKVIYNR